MNITGKIIITTDSGEEFVCENATVEMPPLNVPPPLEMISANKAGDATSALAFGPFTLNLKGTSFLFPKSDEDSFAE